MKLFAFLGNICAGKTTYAQYMADRTGGVVLSFAKPIKKIAKMLEMPDVRKSHQLIGNTFRDEVDPDIWAKKGIKDSWIFTQNNIPVFFDDLRFLNEARLITQAGGMTIGIQSHTTNLYTRYRTRGRKGDNLTLEEFKTVIKTNPTERWAYEVLFAESGVDLLLRNSGNLKHNLETAYGKIIPYLHGHQRTQQSNQTNPIIIP